MTVANGSPSPSERIAIAFKTLITSAKSINDASEELTKPIASLERALKRLNLGVVCWITIDSGIDEDHYWGQDVGYSRIRRVHGNWRLAIRTIEGPEHDPAVRSQEVWPFSDAPRHLRVKAVDKLPELIEALVKTTDATASRLKKKVAPATRLADAISELLNPQDR